MKKMPLPIDWEKKKCEIHQLVSVNIMRSVYRLQKNIMKLLCWSWKILGNFFLKCKEQTVNFISLSQTVTMKSLGDTEKKIATQVIFLRLQKSKGGGNLHLALIIFVTG